MKKRFGVALPIQMTTTRHSYNEILVQGKYMHCAEAKVQNSCVRSLGLARVQIGKYWILVPIQEPEITRRYK